MKKRKLRKPQRIHLIDGICIAMCENAYGYKTVRIHGYPLRLSKVEQLAKWFTAASAWLTEQEGEK